MLGTQGVPTQAVSGVAAAAVDNVKREATCNEFSWGVHAWQKQFRSPTMRMTSMFTWRHRLKQSTLNCSFGITSLMPFTISCMSRRSTVMHGHQRSDS